MFGLEEDNENQKGAAERACLRAGDGNGVLEEVRRTQSIPILERRMLGWSRMQRVQGIAWH